MDTFAANSSATGNSGMADGHNMRTMLLSGDYFLGSVIAVTLAKLVLRLRTLGVLAPPAANRVAAEAMLVKLQRHSSKHKHGAVEGHMDAKLPAAQYSCTLCTSDLSNLELQINKHVGQLPTSLQLPLGTSRHLASDRMEDSSHCEKLQGSRCRMQRLRCHAMKRRCARPSCGWAAHKPPRTPSTTFLTTASQQPCRSTPLNAFRLAHMRNRCMQEMLRRNRLHHSLLWL